MTTLQMCPRFRVIISEVNLVYTCSMISLLEIIEYTWNGGAREFMIAYQTAFIFEILPRRKFGLRKRFLKLFKTLVFSCYAKFSSTGIYSSKVKNLLIAISIL